LSSLYLFALAAQNAHWLDARQSAIAANVANADTPGYRAVDVRPFSAVLASSAAGMSVTQPGDIEASMLEPETAEATESGASDATLSGNSVHIEGEMMKLGEVSRQYALSANVRRVFQQLFVASLK
jgi:flagellar basal-body rod protein FlgB